MHLWEINQTTKKVNHIVEDHEVEYYVKDDTNTSKIRDIYGTRVVKRVADSRKSLRELRKSNVETFESDISEEVKFLHKRYKDIDFKPNPKDYKIANIDIEIQCANEFPKPELAKYPINLITVDFYRTDEIVTLGLNEYHGQLLNKPGFRYIYCESEEILLTKFCELIKKEKTQAITGWNCIHENSSVWLKDRIRSIKTLSNNNITSSDGIVTNVVCTGDKETTKITLVNGSNIISSNSHVFPIVSIQKNKYHNHNLKDRFVNTRVGNFPSLDTNDIFLKVEFGNNINTDYTYRQYLLDNIDFIKNHPFFNCFIPDRILTKYMSKKELKRWSRFSIHYMYKEIKVTDNDLIDIITNEKEFGYVYRNIITNIQLSDIIGYELCRLIGLIYTDGTKADKGYAFYNNDKRLIWDARNICRKNCLLIAKSRAYGKDGNHRCGRLKFGTNNVFTLLAISFYGYDKKKSLNLDIFSRFSKIQFKYIFSGMVDGDGWVGDNKSIGFCNYNGNDIEKIHELLLWNGVFSSRTKNRIGIKRISANQDFVSSLPLRQRQKMKSQKTLNFKVRKNTYSNKLRFLFYDGFALVKVKSIESCGINTCYDITTESHLFTTNCGIKTHNCNNFDIPYICNRIENLGIQDQACLSYLGRVIKKRNDTYQIPGLALLDLMELYKKFSYQNQPSYSLNYIGLQEVGEGKLDFEGQINDLWDRDWDLFVDYNVQDTALVRKIEFKRKFVDLVINLCTQTRTPFEKVYSTISIVEGYMLRYLHKVDMVFPDLPLRDYNCDEEEEDSIEGGYVESHPGYYRKDISIDAESLYPSIMRMFNISPETKIIGDMIRDCHIHSVNPNVAYTQVQGVLPKIVSDIFFERKKFKNMMFEAENAGNTELAEYLDSQQMIRKILINSIYGVLCNRFFHFYDLDNAANVTGHGREAIQYISNCINDYFSNHFYKVAHKYYPNHKLEANSIPKRIVFVNDTDSAYIWFEHIYNLTNSGESFLEWTLNFEKIILQPFLTKCMDIYAKKYNTENLINFKREKIILKQYVQGKKKYATQIIANEKIVYDTPVLKVTGIEINRSDLCQYSRKKLKKLLDIMMAGDEYSYPNKDDMLEYIRSAYKEFKSQSIQDISAPKGINGYNKYDVVLDETFSNFKPHTPMHNKASMIYNFIIKKEHLPYMEINDGTKMKYVFVNPRNKYKTNVIGYVGNYPKEFQKIFKIDYDEQFEKQFKAIGQRMFDVLDFGEITLKDSKIMSFIEEE